MGVKQRVKSPILRRRPLRCLSLHRLREMPCPPNRLPVSSSRTLLLGPFLDPAPESPSHMNSLQTKGSGPPTRGPILAVYDRSTREFRAPGAKPEQADAGTQHRAVPGVNASVDQRNPLLCGPVPGHPGRRGPHAPRTPDRAIPCLPNPATGRSAWRPWGRPSDPTAHGQ